MGGKSRKSGGISRALIDKIKSGGKLPPKKESTGLSEKPKCGSKPKPKKGGFEL